MALLDKEGNYIRVENNNKYCNFVDCYVYSDKNLRNLEKNIFKEVNNFYNKCFNKIKEEYSVLNDHKDVDECVYTELFDKLSELKDLTHSILTGSNKLCINDLKFIEFYKSNGFDERWLNIYFKPSLFRCYTREYFNSNSKFDCYLQLKKIFKKGEYKDC